MPKLRVGVPRELYCRPLAWGFLKGHHGDLFSTTLHSSAQIGALLERGTLDIGLLSPIDVQRVGGLRVLADLCVAACGPSRTMLLVSSVPPAEVRRVAIEHNSRLAALLVEIVLRARFGVPWLETRRRRPLLGRMLADHQAALLTGDDALKTDIAGFEVLDLTEEWCALSERPLVLGLWAVRRGVDLPDLPFYFKSSLRYGLSLMDSLLRESAAELGLEVADVEPCLRGPLSFVLRDDESEGLERLYARAAEHGLLAPARPLELWS